MSDHDTMSGGQSPDQVGPQPGDEKEMPLGGMPDQHPTPEGRMTNVAKTQEEEEAEAKAASVSGAASVSSASSTTSGGTSGSSKQSTTSGSSSSSTY